MEGLEGKKDPDQIPDDIRRRAEFTTPGRDEAGNRVLEFKDKDGNVIHRVSNTPENKTAYGKFKKESAPEVSATNNSIEKSQNTLPATVPETLAEPEAVRAEEASQVPDVVPNDEPPAAPKQPLKKVSLTAPPQTQDQPQATGQLTPEKKNTQERKPEAPPPPPVEERPLSDRQSNVKSPFSIRPQAQEAVIPGLNAYVPSFIESTLKAIPRDDLQERQLTLQEILGNPRQQELFGLFIESFGKQRGAVTIQKYMDSISNPSAMTDLDHQWLTHYQAEFYKRSLLLKEMQVDTKKSDFEYILKNSPAFSFLHNKVGPERANELIKLHMDKAFMRMSEEQFTRVIEAKRANYDIRRSDYYLELRELVRGKTGDGEKLDNFSIRDKPSAEKMEILDTVKSNFFQEILSKSGLTSGKSEFTLDTIDAHREQIMQVLAATISNDTELKREVAFEVITGARVRNIGENVPTLEDAQIESINVIDGQIGETEDLRHRIRDADFRKKVGLRIGKFWEDMDPEEREEISYAQLQDEGKLPKSQRGFFSLWLSSIFDAAFPDIQKKLANEFENEK